jgi:hypothetical protein
MTFKGLKNGDELSVIVTPKMTVCIVVTVDGKDHAFETNSNHAQSISLAVKAAGLEVDARRIGP